MVISINWCRLLTLLFKVIDFWYWGSFLFQVWAAQLRCQGFLTLARGWGCHRLFCYNCFPPPVNVWRCWFPPPVNVWRYCFPPPSKCLEILLSSPSKCLEIPNNMVKELVMFHFIYWTIFQLSCNGMTNTFAFYYYCVSDSINKVKFSGGHILCSSCRYLCPSLIFVHASPLTFAKWFPWNLSCLIIPYRESYIY